MHPTDALGVLYNDDSGLFQNFNVNIFDVVLEDDLMPFPHALPKLEPNLFLEVDASVASQLHIPLSVYIIRLHPSPEFLHGNIIFQSEHPLIPNNNLLQLLSLRQDRLIFLKRWSPKDALSVINPFINIQRGGYS